MFILSCTESSVPVGVISVDKMSEILKEVHYSEASIPTSLSATDSKKLLLARYNRIFEKYEVDKNEFLKSMKYYTENPEKLDIVYLKIIDLINQDDLTK